MQWREARLRAVAATPGNLSLVSYQPVLQEPAPIEVIPGATVRRAGERDGVIVAAEPALGVEVDGTPVSGDTFVPRLRPDGGPLIRHERHLIDVFSLDGADYELRIYDEHAENLSNFAGIDVYDFDEALVLDGVFTRYAVTGRVPWEFTRSTDTGHTKRVPGTIAVAVEGTQYDLLAFLDGDDLVLVFADATTGSESYAPGRFLRMPRPPADGAVRIDFNRAFLPPCGFSDFYSCPIPPPQNRIAIPIRAGEKRALWREARQH